MLKRNSLLLASFLAISTLLAAGPAAAQAALAKCDAAGNLKTYGGFNTNGASCQKAGAGYYRITFDGLYALSNADDVVINATAESAQFGVSNAYVISATVSQIVVGLYTWQSNTTTTTDNTFFITVFTGRSPPLLPPPG